MNEKILIPFSVLISAIIIGLAIYFVNTDNSKKSSSSETEVKKEEVKKIPIKVNEKDYIVGNKNADVFIIEYSDLECKFCKRYNDNVSKKLKEKYLKDGKVGFVFRNFPLTIHPSAFGEAIALECAGKIGGSEKFEKYKEQIFLETSSNGKFNSKRLPEIAEIIGIEKNKFNLCLKDNESSKRVKESYQEGIDAGVKGTPTVFIQLKSGETFPAVADFHLIDKALEDYFNQQDEIRKVTQE